MDVLRHPIAMGKICLDSSTQDLWQRAKTGLNLGGIWPNGPLISDRFSMFSSSIVCRVGVIVWLINAKIAATFSRATSGAILGRKNPGASLKWEGVSDLLVCGSCLSLT